MRLFLIFAFLLFSLAPLNAAEFGLKVSFPEGATDFEVKNGIKTGFESAIFALPKYFEEGSDLKVKILVIEGRSKIDITATSKGRMKISEKISGLKREAVLLGKNLAIRFAKKLLRKRGISLSREDTAIMAGGKISSRKKKQVIVFDLRGEGDKKLISILSARIRASLASLSGLDVKDKALMDNQMLDAGLSKEQCTDLSCQIEIAGALGVEEAVTGQYSTISGLTIITLNRVAIDTNSTIDTKTLETESSSAKELIKSVAKLSKELYGFADSNNKVRPAKEEKNDSSEKDFWEAVKTSSDKADFESYLKEYPNGKYQTVAKLKIKQIEREGVKSETANTDTGPDAEIEFWNAIKNSSDKADFESYLEDYPNGKYKKIAKIKVKNLGRAGAGTNALASIKPREPVMSDIDLKNCKARNYYFNAESELGLNPKLWCGDIKNRFKKVNSGNKFVYDRLLKGHWSKRSDKAMKWQAAKAYCSNLGSGWQMPDAYQMLSLFSENKDKNGGYINPIFSDNDRKRFWSSTMVSSSRAWFFYFDNAVVINYLVEGFVRVRCFRPN